MDTDTLKRNIEAVHTKIRLAAQKSGRPVDAVKLIAVSKTKPVELINEAISLGITAIGENKVQELLVKLPDLAAAEVHMIGRLQSNKAKQVVGKAALIHSLDRLSLASEIDAQSQKAGIVSDCLVQVNIGEEEQKGGVLPDDTEAFIASLGSFAGIRVRGLMCIPPVCNRMQTAAYFNRMCKIMQNINKQKLTPDILTELSMGMSGDFDIAVEEGATMVRVGSAIFGERVNQI